MSGTISFNSPDTVVAPYGAYSHTAVVSAGTRLLFTSGQVGETRESVVPETVEEQYKVALTNIAAILEANGATPADIVKLTTYLVTPIAPAEMRMIRESVFGDIKPAATMLPVSKLAAPGYLVEIEAVAAIR